tara:strand:- start:721 stop:1263 length:543 start_codon:yes stop_codon:yes gene_type:complete
MFEGHSDHVIDMVIDKNTDILYSCSGKEACIKSWNIQTGKFIRDFRFKYDFLLYNPRSILIDNDIMYVGCLYGYLLKVNLDNTKVYKVYGDDVVDKYTDISKHKPVIEHMTYKSGILYYSLQDNHFWRGFQYVQIIAFDTINNKVRQVYDVLEDSNSKVNHLCINNNILYVSGYNCVKYV